MSMMKVPLRVVGNYIRHHHMNRAVALGAHLCNKYLRFYWNELFFDTDRNGELRLLRTLSDIWRDSPTITVFDVGAHIGTYAEQVRAILPRSIVHCFEIVPQTRRTLANRLGEAEKVLIREFGLSSSNGSISIAIDTSNNSQSRVTSPLTATANEIMECAVKKGDVYVKENEIANIDLLKIDTEGHEMAVLEGFREMLHQQRVRVIQFEYGTTWIPTRRFLHEAYSLLEPLGYRIGRLFPDGVYFKTYNRLEDDQFRMGNYVAVHGSSAAIIEALNLNADERIWKLRRK